MERRARTIAAKRVIKCAPGGAASNAATDRDVRHPPGMLGEPTTMPEKGMPQCTCAMRRSLHPPHPKERLSE